jgi:hypothetical protein
MKKITNESQFLKNKTSIFAVWLYFATSFSAQTFSDFNTVETIKYIMTTLLNRTNSIPRFFRAVIPIPALPKKEMIIIW